jgi:hypothetical protein
MRGKQQTNGFHERFETQILYYRSHTIFCEKIYEAVWLYTGSRRTHVGLLYFKGNVSVIHLKPDGETRVQIIEVRRISAMDPSHEALALSYSIFINMEM